MKKLNILQTLTLKISAMTLLIFASFSLHAQIEVAGGNQNPWTPENLISNVFLGDGVEVTNITYSGTADAVGYFSNGFDDVGIERGLIMSSGQAVTAATPNNLGSTSGGTSGNTLSCPELSSFATGPLFDIAAYEITFVPVSDTLRFRYVFASEEYPEYACTGFNDAFGFFITGPNPAGGNYNDENIALVPDPADPTGLTFTTTQVTINNVNGNGINPGAGCDFDFAQYYNDNSGSNTLTYDAYLDVFTAQVVVIPCEPYTIKLAVSDVGDGVWDTSVFLEAKSFGTGALEVEATTVSLDGTMVEGCANGEICFALPSFVENNFPIDYTLIGTATNGVDYEPVPLDLFIAQGDSIVCVPVIPLEDGIVEGIETIGIDVQRDPCNRDTFWMYINDNNIVPPQLQNDTTICMGDTVFLDGTLDIPLPDPPTFSNNTIYEIPDPPPVQNPDFIPVISEIEVFGVQPFDLQDGVIKRVCIDSILHVFDFDLQIYLVSPGGQFIELSTNNGQDCDDYIQTCFTPTATTTFHDIVPLGYDCVGGEPANFTGDFQIDGVWEDLWDGGSPTNGTWQLLIVDNAAGFAGDLYGWNICFEPLYQLNYNWEPAEGLSCTDCPDPAASPDQTTTYILTVMDSYGCSVQDSITITVDEVLDAPVVDCGTISSNGITFTWNDVGTSNYEVNIDGMGWVPASPGPLVHEVTGLALNQTVTIEVRGIGDCDGLIGTADCSTPDCPAPTVSLVNVTGNTCFGNSEGTVEVLGDGANPPFTYQLLGNTNSTGIFTNLPAGDYNVLVIDDVMCSVSLGFTITEPDSLATVDVLDNDISCFGANDGEGTVTVTGGTAPYSFVWSTGVTDSLATNLIDGENYVTITDANGCQTIDTVMVTEPATLTASIAADSIQCFGGVDGTAVLTISGGTADANGDYTILWDMNAGGQTNAIAVGLSAQTYTALVTDANGCTVEASITMEEYDALDLTNISSTDATCNGVNDGTVTVVPTGGAGGYTYQWLDIFMQTTQTADLLGIGTYTVIVSDANGCTATTEVAVNSPNAIVPSFTTSEASCFNSADGGASVTVTGGTAGYSYEWSDGGAAIADRDDLPAGDYEVTVLDANGCFEILEIEITAPSEIVLDLDFTPVLCQGGNDGTATVTVSGGSGGYTYLWNQGTNTTDPTVNGLSVGFASVVVTDMNGCIQQASTIITEPGAITLATDFTEVDCFGNSTGTATVIADGGVGNFTYQWDAAANNQTTDVATNLPAGTYSVIVSDENMCSEVISVNVSEPTELTSTMVGVNASCFDFSNGTATVTPDGGTLPYTYLWSNGQNTASTTSLAAGTFTVTITDDRGCTLIDEVDIDQPTELVVTLGGDDVDCFGGTSGTATATPSGGAGGYSFAWSDSQSTGTASNLAAGAYTVTLSDTNGCTVTESIQIGQPDELVVINALIDDVDCNGAATGGISVNPNGGTMPYSYLWSTGGVTDNINNLNVGSYTVTITDDNGCSVVEAYDLVEPTMVELSFNPSHVNCFMGNDGEIDMTVTGGAPGSYTIEWSGPGGFSSTSEDILNLLAGDYQVIVTDANGCSTTQVITVSQPATGVTTSISAPMTICNGATNGTATVVANGGTPPYAYAWNDPNNQTTASVANLPPGTYIVTVSDQSGCTFTETAIVEEQPVISVDLSQTSANCHDASDGSATIENIFYGNNSATISDFNISWNSTPSQSSANATNLTGGVTYTVLVTNDLGCTGSASITIDNPDEVTSSIAEVTDVNCYLGADGTATAVGEGGVAPYSYTWDLNAGNQNTQQATNLPIGNYFVTVMDANGCTSIASAEINQPEELEILGFAVQDVDCYGEATGEMTASVGGGTAPYNYTWSTGSNALTISDLVAAEYILTLTDASGCTTTATEVVQQPDQPLTSIADFTDVTCHGDYDGQILFFPQGGTSPYMYSVDGVNFNGSPTQVGLPAGIYTEVFVRDANGCLTWHDPVTITEPGPLLVDLGPDITINYGEIPQLSAQLNAGGNLIYNWLPSDDRYLTCFDCPAPYVDSLNNQVSYTLEVTDPNGCSGSDVINIYVIKYRDLLVPTGFSPNGDGNNDLLLVHGREGSTVLTFQVFDRWGELVYENGGFSVNDPAIGWDGKFKGQDMNPGVFVWQVEVEFEDGETKVYKGNTTLIR